MTELWIGYNGFSDFILFNVFVCFFFFNDTATTEIYTLSLHDALPISCTCPTHVLAYKLTFVRCMSPK